MAFTGFQPDTVRFFQELAEHNDKTWFEANKARYEQMVVEPARALVEALGDRMAESIPAIQAEPRMNGSIFRIYRDTRFSKDKTPYKTNLAIFLWEGSRPKLECPGFYMNLQPTLLMLGAGIWMLPPHLLAAYRQAVVHPEHGPALREAVAAVRAFAGQRALEATGCGGTIDQYKRVPTGFDPAHENAEFLKYKGLHAGVEMDIPEVLYGPELVEMCARWFEGVAPVHRWLVCALEGA